MKTADIEFTADGTPKSKQFDDYYFNEGLGIEETNYVFVEHNHLTERFQNLPEHGHFTLAETGFGTGLNFLVVWQNFLANAPKTARLTFVSCEKFPLSQHHLARAHQHLAPLNSLCQQLQQQYPPALAGYHLLEFDRVNLILMFDDVSHALAELTAPVDAWFLDGFSPSKNPDMWQADLFFHVGRLSHLTTTLATFSSARLVRDGLTANGFKLQKRTGFGKKREMIQGHYLGFCGPQQATSWPSAELALPPANRNKKIAIIGAGIAGVTTAIELQKRGYQVTLFEKNAQVAGEGSGNKQGAVYAKLSGEPTVSNRFYAQSLVLAQRQLKNLSAEVPHQSCGLVQVVHNQRELKRLQQLQDNGFIPAEIAQYKTAEQLSQLTGVTLTDEGLWFSEGGWVSPSALVSHLIETHQLNVSCNTEVLDIQAQHAQWTLSFAQGNQQSFDQVIITSAFHSKKLPCLEHLPLNAIAGQVTQLQATSSHDKLKAVICTDRYVMPTLNNQLTIGSTFRVKSENTDVTTEDHQENITNLKHRVPSLFDDNERVVDGRAAVRCTSPDYLPLVGAICEPEQLKNQFRIPLQRNRAHKETPAQALPGLWVNVAHGSKGLCSSHLSAKLLAAMIAGEPLPMQTTLVNALNPNRFIVRGLLREKRQKLNK